VRRRSVPRKISREGREGGEEKQASPRRDECHESPFGAVFSFEFLMFSFFAYFAYFAVKKSALISVHQRLKISGLGSRFSGFAPFAAFALFARPQKLKIKNSPLKTSPPPSRENF